MIRVPAECARHAIEASADEVFEAWSTPDLVAEWWGPDGFTTRVLELDFRVGGRFAIEMNSPKGSSCVMTGVYRRIQAPELLEFEVHDHCNLDLPYGVAKQESRSLVTVELSSSGSETLVTITHVALNDDYEKLAAVSWSQSLTKIARLIASSDRPQDRGIRQ